MKWALFECCCLLNKRPFQQKFDDGFHTKIDGFRAKNDGFHTKIDGFRAKNDGFRAKNDGFRAKIDGFHTKTDDRSRRMWGRYLRTFIVTLFMVSSAKPPKMRRKTVVLALI